MSVKYPRGLTLPDRSRDFKVPGLNCDLSVWVVRPDFFLVFHVDHHETLLDDTFTYLMRRSKRGKWCWTFNTHPDMKNTKWQYLGDSDEQMQKQLEREYQNYLLSKQIEQSLTENIME